MTKFLIGGYSGDKGAGRGITVVDDGQASATVPADSPSWNPSALAACRLLTFPMPTAGTSRTASEASPDCC